MKRIFIFLLAFILVIVTFFAFDSKVYAEDNPYITMTQPYFEVEFDFSYDSIYQEIEFVPPLSGFYLIQVFGDEAFATDEYTYCSRLAVRYSDSNTYLATSFPQTGYGSGRLIYCQLPSTYLTIEVWFSLFCEYARVSITYVDLYYSIECYEDIETYGPDTVQFVFTDENIRQAEIALIFCGYLDEGDYGIAVSTSNNSEATVYLMDPTAESLYGGAVVYSSGSYYLREGVSYYLAVFLDEGFYNEPYVEIDSIVVTITFLKVG